VVGPLRSAGSRARSSMALEGFVPKACLPRLRLPLRMLRLAMAEISEQVQEGGLAGEDSEAIQDLAEKLKGLALTDPVVKDNYHDEVLQVQASQDSNHAPPNGVSIPVGHICPLPHFESNFSTASIHESASGPPLPAVTRTTSSGSKVGNQAATRFCSQRSNSLRRTLTNSGLGGAPAVTSMKCIGAFDEILKEEMTDAVSSEKLRASLCESGVSPALARKLSKQADKNGDGVIDRREWLRVVSDNENLEIREWTDALRRQDSEVSEHHEEVRSRCMLSQGSYVRVFWDIGVACMLFYIAISLPYVWGFSEGVATGGVRSMDTMADLFFMVDVALNFRTGYYTKDGIEILHWRPVSKRYLRTWFVLDVVSSFPIDLVTDSKALNLQPLKILKGGKISKVFKFIKLLRLSRLVKMAGGSELSEQIEELFASSHISTTCSLVLIMLTTLLLTHWLACCMMFSGPGFLDSYSFVQDTGWSRYVSAYYWAMTTMTTVGYGDITPKSDWERLYAIFAMIVGGGCYGYVVGSVTSIVSRKDVHTRTYQQRMEVISGWLSHHQLPWDLRRRVRRYFKLQLAEKPSLEYTVINDLNGKLREEVVQHLIHDDVQSNPLFDNLPKALLAHLIEILQRVEFKEADKVCSIGDHGTTMYIIVNGTACMSFQEMESEDALALRSGDSFGEEVLLDYDDKYHYCVVAMTPLTMDSIAQAEFLACFKNMPRAVAQMRKNVCWSKARYPIDMNNATTLHSKGNKRLSILELMANLPMDFAENVHRSFQDIREHLDRLDGVIRTMRKAVYNSSEAAGSPRSRTEDVRPYRETDTCREEA